MIIPVVSFTSGTPSMWGTISWLSLSGQSAWSMAMCAVGPEGVPFN